MGYDPVIKAFNGSAVSAYAAGFAITSRLYLISGSSRPISALDTGLSDLSGLMSSKLDESATSDFYSTSNPSGFITGVDLSPYQTTADMSGYYTTANESGFVDSAYVEGQVSGKQDVSGMTAYQPVGDYQPSGDYIYVSALGWAEV